MRFAVLALLLVCGPAQAAENYIARGHAYSPDEPVLPDLNSEQDLINRQADIYEAELFIKQREQKIWETQQNRFRFSQELKGGDFNPEY
jgi:hypothetical protein